MVGPGLLGGSMILSFEQLLIDIEIFRMNKQSHRGIVATEEQWLDEVIERVGPAGNYLGELSTVRGIRSGVWLTDRLGVHEPLQSWERAGKPTILEEVQEKIEAILATHKPLPLGDIVEKELAEISRRARDSLA